MLLLLNAISHFLVDATCAAALFSCGVEGAELVFAVAAYNTLAFSTQCLAGLLLDKARKLKCWSIGAMFTVSCGALFSLPLTLRIALIGLGNSVFHVAAGTITMKAGKGKAAPLGAFVAPGAIGVTVGTVFPAAGKLIALLLAAGAVGMVFVQGKEDSHVLTEKRPSEGLAALGAAVMLAAAVAVRAVGGAVVRFPWNTGVKTSFLVTGFVFLGKALGGAACDRWGVKTVSICSIPIAAVCIAFFPGNMPLSLLGQGLLNLSMPVTLWLMYRAMPDAPAFAFGLAASALWPGTIAGMLFRMTGPALWGCVLGSFLFGLIAILLAEKHVHKPKGDA